MIGRAIGRVSATRGHLVEAQMQGMHVGAGARIVTRRGTAIGARVVAVDAWQVMLAPFGALDGIASGDPVIARTISAPLGTPLLGRACDAVGMPIDGGARFRGALRPLEGTIDLPVQRRALTELCWTGVRAIDGPLAFGRGARIGIFGAPGCGKSTLLEAIAHGATADAVVVGLIGERGREAERWLDALDARTTIVCATSDRAPAERVRAAGFAFAHADALRRRGMHVLVILDSLARVAHALRDVALALGEAVGRGGYPPSVFAALARLLERAGSFESGSITLLASVLSDGAGEHDPVSDAARAALDGHIALSPELAQRGCFPAIDVPASLSRTLAELAATPHLRGARAIRAALAALAETREIRQLGFDPTSGDPALARAVAAEPALERFLRQDATPSGAAATLAELDRLSDMIEDGYLG